MRFPSPGQLTLDKWDAHYRRLLDEGLREPSYGGPLSRHVNDGDLRLRNLRFDNSPAALRLWNFLLTEDDRLHEARARGRLLVGAMKDLGTVPVLAFSFPNVTAFYPDGAWWTPCVMEMSDSLFAIADSHGIHESFCPVRAMIGAFVNGEHFPIPDLLVCSAGATCDDFSAIAQRIHAMGHPVFFWEIPHRRRPDPGESFVTLPGGFQAPRALVDFVRDELERVKSTLEEKTGQTLDDAALLAGIRRVNRVRALLGELRDTVFGSDSVLLPALEMLIAEMLAIHFCSDLEESIAVLTELVVEVRSRAHAGASVLPPDRVRLFWVNPVADLRMMNRVEELGARVCGTELLFSHALDPIPEELPSMEALARMALADPMAGSAWDRAERIRRDATRYRAEAVVISRIPGASHCATEGEIIARHLRESLGLPVVEVEVPPISDALAPAIANRLEALLETARARRDLAPGSSDRAPCRGDRAPCNSDPAPSSADRAPCSSPTVMEGFPPRPKINHTE